MIKKLRKWSWTAFWVIMVISYLGAVSNENLKTVTQILVLGTSAGLSFGLIMAFITRSD